MKSKTEEFFEMFWKAKPKRLGSNPKDKARERFLRLVVHGQDPEKIISAAHKWKAEAVRLGKEETEYIPMAVTWLNQTRFNDYGGEGVDGPVGPTQAELEAKANAKGWHWNGERWVNSGVST